MRARHARQRGHWAVITARYGAPGARSTTRYLPDLSHNEAVARAGRWNTSRALLPERPSLGRHSKRREQTPRAGAGRKEKTKKNGRAPRHPGKTRAAPEPRAVACTSVHARGRAKTQHEGGRLDRGGWHRLRHHELRQEPPRLDGRRHDVHRWRSSTRSARNAARSSTSSTRRASSARCRPTRSATWRCRWMMRSTSTQRRTWGNHWAKTHRLKRRRPSTCPRSCSTASACY